MIYRCYGIYKLYYNTVNMNILKKYSSFPNLGFQGKIFVLMCVHTISYFSMKNIFVEINCTWLKPTNVDRLDSKG